MSVERSHGKARPTLPRSSDLATPETVGEPPTARTSGGHFARGNQLAVGGRWKHLIAESLGRDLQGEAGHLGGEAYRLFRALMQDMPCDCASVRLLVAARARAATLSARFARRAGELGLESAEAVTALSEAHKWDARAERLAVTSLDIASRLAGRAGRRELIDLGEVIAEASKPRGTP